MKKGLFVALLAIAISFYGCTKCDPDNPDARTSNAVITGMDPNKCACCWGWIIEIDGAVYKFEKVPPGSPIDLNNLVYPVPVNVTWNVIQGTCGNMRINILSISR